MPRVVQPEASRELEEDHRGRSGSRLVEFRNQAVERALKDAVVAQRVDDDAERERGQ